MNIHRSFSVLLLSGLILILGSIQNTADARDNNPGTSLSNIHKSGDMVARGEYLVNHVMACFNCHSERDWGLYSAPVVPGTEGQGGHEFSGEYGTVYATNITPYELGDWTDDEIFRALTSGIDHNGDSIMPIMPYERYSTLAEQDIRAIVAYLRTIEPIEFEVPERELNPDFDSSGLQVEPAFQDRPDPSDTVASGQYLVTAAGCVGCHTPWEKAGSGEPFLFSGGLEFNLPGGTVVSHNITPDVESGIGDWTQDKFIHEFAEKRSRFDLRVITDDRPRNTPMGWNAYAGMTDQDLGAIYDFLMTLDPVYNETHLRGGDDSHHDEDDDHGGHHDDDHHDDDHHNDDSHH
ncbi:MAG TPA: c-type cytochrome [bacterium]|jgi:mono/diheme cytochrome c family protein